MEALAKRRVKLTVVEKEAGMVPRIKSWKDKLKADPTRIMEAYIANTHALGFNGDRFNAEFYYENKA